MASDNALYRRYRPSRFADLSGADEHLVSLAKSIAEGHPHHAYLLVGPRGVGKTTTARLIAMGLNCAKGPTDSPCGECESCLSIVAGEALDVQEIDAASSNSVDDIRALRNKVAVAPAFGAYRIFILDEVHMLSKSAWNALLKTLEEPPGHTVFVLCTTETSKVPETVTSRCHRLRFRTPTAKDLSQRILWVAEQEKIAISEEATHLLARASRGSYRDALQLLEQAENHAEGEIDEKVARVLLGSQEEVQIFSLIQAIAEEKMPEALALVTKLSSSYEPEVVLRELESLARDILIVSALRKIPASLQGSPAHDELLEQCRQTLKAPGAARILDEIANALVAIRAGADPRVRLELAIAKAADPSLAPPSTQQVAARLDRIEGAVMSKQHSRRPT